MTSNCPQNETRVEFNRGPVCATFVPMKKRKCKVTKDLFAYAEDNRASIVYMATCTVNGKKYIGITRNGLKRRKGHHIAAAKRNAYPTCIFHKAIRLHGEESFVFEVVRECATYKEAAQEEVRMIAEIGPEYNLSPGGEAVLGFRPSAQSVEKMRRALKKNPTRYWLGKKRPDIAEKQRRRLTGRADLMVHLHKKAHTPETWAKISATKKGKGSSQKHLEAMERRRKPLICLEDGRIFYGAQAAADALGCKKHAVDSHLGGQQKTVRGFTLAYLDKAVMP
jgi:group I intron endonuclease